MNFYVPLWHGFSAANLTLAVIGLGAVAWMLYWRFLTRRFDPPPIKWRGVVRSIAAYPRTGPVIDAGERDIWRDEQRGPK